MAFGALLDTGTITTTNIPAQLDVTSVGGLSGSVSVGDLVIATLAEEIALTVATVTDNLGNTYTASNAGTLSGAISGRMFYSRVSVAGTLNVVHFNCTSSSHNAAAAVAVFEGPFDPSPVDANIANNTDATTPHACPVTGTLSQAQEVVVSWGAGVGTAGANQLDGVGVGTLATKINVASACIIISYTLTAATTSIAHTFTSSSNPTAAVLGTTSFKALLGQPTVKRFGGIPFMSPIGRGVW